MIRKLLAVSVLAVTLMGVGSAEDQLPGICYPKVEERHSGKTTAVYIGTGSFITDRLVLTCQHNIEDHVVGETKLTVTDRNDHVYTNVVILRQDAGNDLALLKVLDEVIREHETIDISTGDGWYQGPINSFGYWGEQDKYYESSGQTDGKFYASSERTIGIRAWFTHTSVVYQGMSGGPALDPAGKLVGVNVAKDNDNRTYTVGLPVIKKFLE